jgi:hypothetical protein
MKYIISILALFLITCHLKGQVDKKVIIVCDSVQITLIREKFDTTGKKFEYYKNFLISVNNEIIFGSDGEIPKYKLVKAIVTKGGQIYCLQTDNMYNPWFGDNEDYLPFRFLKDGTNYHLKMLFSDGAGSYAAEWLIVGKSCVRTLLSSDDQLIYSIFYKGEQ